MSPWKKPSELFYGWRMVGIGCLARFLGGGVHFYGFTVFFLPLSRDLGLSRAATSLVFSLSRAEGALEAPFAGYLIDRFGPRPVMLASIALCGVGYVLLSGINSYLTFALVYMGVISVFYGPGFGQAPMVLANNWFSRHRGMAMSFVSSSIGLGGALISPLLAFGVHRWGWRPTALLAGLVVLSIGIPLAWMVRTFPEDMGLRPDGAPLPKPGTSSHSHSQSQDLSLPEALRTSAFWLIALATLFRMASISSLIVHFVPIMVWKGLDEQRAAFLLGAMALLGFPSTLFLGWLGDRINKVRLMALCTLVAGGAFFILIYARHELLLWLFLPFLALLEGVFPVNWAAVAEFYGRTRFATIRGSMSFIYLWGGVAGPVIAGLLYDRTQSYALTLWGIAVMLILSSLFYVFLQRPWELRMAALQSTQSRPPT